MMDNKLLSPEQALRAMSIFLERYCKQGQGCDDLTALLSDIQPDLWKDGLPADPAMWRDWLDAVQAAIEEATP
jgi:hypothetical protein